MTRIRAVLLDAGGTLFTEVPSRAGIYAEAGRRRGLSVEPEEMATLMGAVHDLLPQEVDGHFRYSEGWFRVFIDEVFARTGFHGDWDDLHRELFERFKSAASFRLFPEVRGVVKRLKGAGIRLAVVSNWSPTLPALLARLGLGQDFDAVLSSAVARLEKPDPALFRKALAELGTAPAAALHAGDHPLKDVMGARSAGIDALLVDRSGDHAGDPGRIDSLEGVLERVGLPRLH